jgi:hypothetical protein
MSALNERSIGRVSKESASLSLNMFLHVNQRLFNSLLKKVCKL